MKVPTLVAAAAAFAFSVISALAQPIGTITLYTSQPNDQVAATLKDFAKTQPDVKIEVFRSGTTEIMNKLQAEAAAGAPKADVLLLADEISMMRIKAAGLLLPYPDAPTADLPASIVDQQKSFFGTRLITSGIVYNTKLVANPPKSWSDLLTPDVASKTILPSPLYSGAAVMNVGTIVQQPQFGWKFYETLAANGAVATNANGAVVEAVARGEKAYGIIIDYMAMNAKAKGSPVDYVFPTEGVTIMSQPVAIVKTTKNLEAARAFADWQLSEAAQKAAVAQGYFPALPSVQPPAGYPAVSAIKVLPVDLDMLLSQDEANKQKFSEIFGG